MITLLQGALIIFAAVALILGIITGYLLITGYHDGLNDDAPFLSRDHIKAIYKVNPRRLNFEVAEDDFSYTLWIWKTNADFDDDYSPKGLNDYIIPFNVKFFDWLWLVGKYSQYEEESHKTLTTYAQKEALQEIINCVQFDIDKLKKESERQIDTAREVTKKIQENINQGDNK